MKIKEKMLLLLLMCLVIVNGENQDCSHNNEEKAMYDRILRMSDAIGSVVPGVGAITAMGWMWSDQQDDGVVQTIKCYLHNFNQDKLWDTYLNQISFLKEPVKNHDIQTLKERRKDLEAIHIPALISSKDYLQASAWPVLMYYARLHLSLNLLLMPEPNDSKYALHAHKHDEYVEFYAKLILRYWKPFREYFIEQRYKGTFMF